jgi:hypothetical protein
MKRPLLLALAILAICSGPISEASNGTVSVRLGRATIRLEGPWRFHIGDDPRWSGVKFDDSRWRIMDLTPRRGSTDGDVGLEGYSSGWAARGFPGYYGFAWYRIHLSLDSLGRGTLALLGPLAVDSAYQIYANGELLGGVGSFSKSTPRAYSDHYPRVFPLSSNLLHSGGLVIAVRVWGGPWISGAPGSGGIHIAPVIGERSAIVADYRLQWVAIFAGYAVDAALTLIFVLIAALVACLWRCEPSNRAYPWLIIALLLSALQRGNQPFFFWSNVETVPEFVLAIGILVGPMTFGAWTMAWRAWFKIGTPRWIPAALVLLTLVLMMGETARYPWVFGIELPKWSAESAGFLVRWIHIIFLLLFGFVGYAGVRLRNWEGIRGLSGMLSIAVVLFSGLLTAAHVPGIWFPWGVGVSLSEFASIALDGVLCYLLLKRFWSYASAPQKGLVMAQEWP